MTDLAALLKKYRLDLTSEKRTQADIQQVLDENDVDYSREYRMTGHDGVTDIPDFFSIGTIIEVKANSAKATPTIRQLERYAAHGEVIDIILVTNRAMNLPAEINGKPIRQISTGRAWM